MWSAARLEQPTCSLAERKTRLSVESSQNKRKRENNEHNQEISNPKFSKPLSEIANDSSQEINTVGRVLNEDIQIPTSFSKHYYFTQALEADNTAEEAVSKFEESSVKMPEKMQKAKGRHKRATKKKRPTKRQLMPEIAPAVYSLEAETRRLATALKHKVLNYLKGVDLKLTEEKKRSTIKQLLYKGALPKPVHETVRLGDIEDAETYRLYVKEVSTNARAYLQTLYKRVRSEIMETTSKGSVALVTPTTSDKRKVRKTIAKCVELLTHADNMRKAARKPLESARRDVTETLRILHKTMDVVYVLRDMSRETVEDVNYLKNGKGLIMDLYHGIVTLEDKSEYIRQRVLREERGILMVLLFPRIKGILLDRTVDIATKGDQMFIDHSLLLVNNEILLRNITLERSVQNILDKYFLKPNYFSIRVKNTYMFAHLNKKDLWEPKNWGHILELGRTSHLMTLQFEPNGREAEAFPRVHSSSKLPKISFNSSGEAFVEWHMPPPQKEPRFRRLTGVWSEPAIRRSAFKLRRSVSWPIKPESEPVVVTEEIRNAKSQRKAKKTDASCSLQ